MRLTRTSRHPQDYSLPPVEAAPQEWAQRIAAAAPVEPVNGDSADGDTPLAAETRWSMPPRARTEPETASATDANPEQIVTGILERAVRDRASDVHLEPTADGMRVRVRADGVLHRISSLPGPMGAEIVSRIKNLSEMNIAERRQPQHGRMTIAIDGQDRDLRVTTAPTAFGEKCVMRIFDTTRAVIELPALGMAPETYDRYAGLIRSPSGMLICAGPPRSGKTTTMYATLGAIDHDEINVVTIEDPIECVFPTFNQIQVDEPAGLTYINGLRTVLHQDPDVILVGEIHDVETARIAAQAALAGRFVLSSLHATDATSALHRLMDMGIESFLIASSLLGLVGQRLVRRVCEVCAGPYAPTPVERSFFERAGGNPDKRDFVLGSGCNVCHGTGYSGCVGIYELLVVTDEMKEFIVGDAPHSALRALAVEQGMTTLRDQTLRLVAANETTIAEAMRTVHGP
jgi:type IV pilus assembly protein PilB